MLQLKLLADMRRMHFFDELNSILSSVPAGEKYIVLGDFSACVESRQVVGDQWSKVRDPHGCGVTNDAGWSYMAFSLPSRQLYVIHSSGRRRYTE